MIPLDSLNIKQREAVETTKGPVLVNAGPGSGKTRVITYRIANLLTNCGINPYNIVALTFTNKASREMSSRILNLTTDLRNSLTISTFHHFCSRILRYNATSINLDSNFSIIDDTDRLSIIKNVMTELKIDPKITPPRVILSAISNAKSLLLNTDGFKANASDNFKSMVYECYQLYEKQLHLSQVVDLDDLLLKVFFMLKSNNSILKTYQNRFEHLMIDEFQDTNIAQYEIAKLLSNQHRNICVVGDPDQSIYSWRNADIRNILDFKKYYSDAKIISLSENYRSSQTILTAAQSIISSNKNRIHKDLWTQNSKGHPVCLTETFNEREEATTILNEVQRLVSEEKMKLSDIAIMYRVNALSRVLEEVCIQNGIPYILVGSIKFYQRQEIKDLLAYLKLIANPKDDTSLIRIINTPSRKIGKKTISDLSSIANVLNLTIFDTLKQIVEEKIPPELQKRLNRGSLEKIKGFYKLLKQLLDIPENTAISEIITRIIEKTQYEEYLKHHFDHFEERLENITEFKNIAWDFSKNNEENSLILFLERISLVNDTDNIDETSSEYLTLITLHQAKGLEYPIVFIIGMEEGMIPHIKSMDSDAEMEEERRLCYVGFTRAKQKLYLSRTFRRGYRGGYERNIPSRFLNDLPKELTFVASEISEPTEYEDDWVNQEYQSPPSKYSSPKNTKTRFNQSSKSIRYDINKDVNPKENKISIGDHITHATFGKGLVTHVRKLGNDYEITIAFTDNKGIKKFLLSMAPITKD
ncbi:MAG: UvrD-helicase domain-containing protein [SAR202 cluster bacterium]|nr:UvrD-helicase domain-containing protein [SAR202 cluster bacterium]